MKDELVEKVSNLHEALKELNVTWSKLDWSEVPVSISESYPFHHDLKDLERGIQDWLEIIKKS